MATTDDSRLDSAIISALYVECSEELRAFLIGVLRDSDLAAEALQTTFARAIEVGHKSREETRKGWLFRVAFNEAMAIRRRQQTHRKSLERMSDDSPRLSDAPEDQAIRWETVDRVRGALQELPEEQRLVVQMRIYEEKTFAVIAEELGTSLGTVLTRMRLAVQKLEGKLRSRQ